MPDTDAKVVILRPETTSAAVQGMPQFFGISGQTAGSKGLSMKPDRLPPRREIEGAFPPRLRNRDLWHFRTNRALSWA